MPSAGVQASFEGAPPGAPDPARPRGTDRAGRWDRIRSLSPWLAVALVAIWTRELSPWQLGAAAVLIVPALAPARGGRRSRVLGLLTLSAAVGSAFAGHRQLARLSRDFDSFWEEREARVYQVLDATLEELLDQGDSTVQDLVLQVESGGGKLSVPALEELRRESGFPALAVYDAAGTPVAWAGKVRGRVPDEVQLGLESYAYVELPLFSYLYFTAPIRSTGGTAVVAYLLRTELPEDLEAELGDLASTFRAATGEEIRISDADRSLDRQVYDLTWKGETLFSVSVLRPSQADRLGDVRVDWIRLVVALLFAAWILLAVSRREADLASSLWAAATLALLLAIFPWSLLLDQTELFSAADFLLPSPGTVTLGRLLAIALAAVVLVGLPRLGRPGPLPAVAAAAVVGVGFPLLTAWVAAGRNIDFLAGSERDWVVYELTLTALLSVLALGAFSLDRRRRISEQPGLWLSASGLSMAALAALAAWHVRVRGELPPWAAAMWAVPTLLALPALGAWPGWRRPLLVWTTSVALATSLALPYAWSQRVESRRAVGAAQLERLGGGVDPFLEQVLLPRLGEEVAQLHRDGGSEVELLFHLASGLAEEGYPVWTTLWNGEIPEWHLPIGVGDIESTSTELARPRLANTLGAGVVWIEPFDGPDAHYLVEVPLDDGATVVSGLIPPLWEGAAFTPLAHLFGNLSEETSAALELVQQFADSDVTAGEEPAWSRAAWGWRGEVGVVFPTARYLARYDVELSRPVILLARAALLLAFNLAVLIAFWGIGRAFGADAPPSAVAWNRWLTTYRGRLTVALFAFFLLSNAIFGTLAYQNIAAAGERTAQVLAERVVQDAAARVMQDASAGGVAVAQLPRLGGGDLLEYRSGQLFQAAAEESVELGLYEGLMPFDVYTSLRHGRERVETRVDRLGRWEYVTAFGQATEESMLGVPMPLQAGATAVRRREVAHLLGFAIVGGAALSFVLALLVGRTLAQPIRTLQIASERVGSGNLGLQLPPQRTDEFAAVFSAFNRMVRRLRRARSALVRTTRRTQAIVEDAATGVIALDGQGRVTLVNPRAEALLGREVTLGEVLVEGDDAASELVHWVGLYFRDRLREAGSEFQFDDRRIRVRARRITREGPLGGAVLSLEDVTDELRTERVLAWGEMARQVAHEVKNPLTPIRLSIQHIQRAHADGRRDFDEILSRNADAMLKEIDRLAAIATSFSRFGAPSEAGAAPLEPVRVGAVVREVLALYATDEGPIRFEGSVPSELPAVHARESEMKEVLVNLLENARAAIEEQGTVRIEASGRDDGVVLSVVDDGSGIPPELLPRIFEPHFSTRSSGTGLGLAIVRRLVESWDAIVSVESESGRGTRVHISLRPWSGNGATSPGAT